MIPQKLILFDSEVRDHLLPITYTRPVCEIRIGILTIRQKWEKWMQTTASCMTQDYLATKFPVEISDDHFLINGSVLPTDELCRLIRRLHRGEALLQNEQLVAARLDREQIENLIRDEDFGGFRGLDLGETPVRTVQNLWDIFQLNNIELRSDFELLTQNRLSQKLDSSNTLIGTHDMLFIEAGATVQGATLNTKTGPIYIAANAEIMEGSLVRGPFYLGENSVLKMGAKIYGATTIGPGCKVGGEVNNTVFLANANKGHDGFIGNAVIGEWCNLGADTNCSNLKNNYDEVKIWNYPTQRFIKTGQQFCGLIMGDHSKAGINTMFNTGTVVGVSSNIFGDGFPRNFIPSFAWGGTHGFETYSLEKAAHTAERVMARRNMELDTEDRLILLRIFEDSAPFRVWERKKTNP